MRLINNILALAGAACMLLPATLSAQTMDTTDTEEEYGEWRALGKATYTYKIMYSGTVNYDVLTRSPLDGSRTKFQMKIEDWGHVKLGDEEYPGHDLIITVRQLTSDAYLFVDEVENGMTYTYNGTTYPVLFSDMYTRGAKLAELWPDKYDKSTAESWYGSSTFNMMTFTASIMPCYHLPLQYEDTWNLVFPFRDENGNEIMETLQFTEVGAVENVLADKADQTPALSGVYTIDGRLARPDGDTTGLPAGLYIVNGKKQLVR